MGRTKVKKGFKSPAAYLEVPVNLFDDEKIVYFVTKFGCSAHIFILRLWLFLAASPGWRYRYEEELFEKWEKDWKISVEELKAIVKYCADRKNGIVVIRKEGEDWFISSPYMENKILSKLMGKRLKDNMRKKEPNNKSKQSNYNEDAESNYLGRPLDKG